MLSSPLGNEGWQPQAQHVFSQTTHSALFWRGTGFQPVIVKMPRSVPPQDGLPGLTAKHGQDGRATKKLPRASEGLAKHVRSLGLAIHPASSRVFRHPFSALCPV